LPGVDEHLLSLAIPGFFVLMALEAVWARLRRKRVYALHDTVTSLACGVGQTLLGIWLNLGIVAVYAALHARAALFRIPREAWWALPLAIVAVDFCHYWFHRSSHRVNALWAGHAVHHQSEEYNLSTALRQSWAEPVQSIPFYLPLAVVGFPLEVFLVAHTLQTIYQFWIHTRMVGRVGPLEWVLNTPSHHRVHHAINPEYIDKNYAGIFILWDRLFGTFAPEREEPAYGTVKPLASFDPYWANLYEWARIAGLALRSGTRREALYAPIAPPEWLPRAMGGPQVVPPVDRARALFDTRPGRPLDLYVAAHFALVLAVSGLLLPRVPELGYARAFWPALWMMTGLGTLGALMHRRRGALVVEAVRLAATPWLALALAGPLGGLVGLGVAAGSLWIFQKLYW
jgi:sterol desaturase/sphingolipid hydroxylase (fatty acid hydroxylase superfamily)